MAGLAAGGAEAVAPTVANWLYGSNPDVKKDAKGNVIASELTAEQKNTLSNIIGLGTAGATGLAGGSVTDVVSSTGLAQTAVEDNRDVVLAIWDNKLGLGKDDFSVGHSAIFEIYGKSITNAFPIEPKVKDTKEELTWQQVLDREKRYPESLFLVNIPDDKEAEFDVAAEYYKNRTTWITVPFLSNQTNCVDASTAILRAGGYSNLSQNLLPAGLWRAMYLRSLSPFSGVQKIDKAPWGSK